MAVFGRRPLFGVGDFVRGRFKWHFSAGKLHQFALRGNDAIVRKGFKHPGRNQIVLRQKKIVRGIEKIEQTTLTDIELLLIDVHGLLVGINLLFEIDDTLLLGLPIAAEMFSKQHSVMKKVP